MSQKGLLPRKLVKTNNDTNANEMIINFYFWNS